MPCYARVGHTHGSQVSNPSWPLYKESLDAHLKIWDKWINERKKSGGKTCTITPEFGPPPYLGPLAKNKSLQKQQWELNL